MEETRYFRLVFKLFLGFGGLLLPVMSGTPRPYDKAVHYWPLDTSTGVRDVITNTTGIRDGRDRRLFFRGPGSGHLFLTRSRLKFGSFKGTCIIDPSKCGGYLTVSLWVNYQQKSTDIYRKQFLAGTSTQAKGSPGFTIYANPVKGIEDRVTFQVNTREKVWLRHTTLKHGIWMQIGFTWSNQTGLDIYKNCQRVKSVPTGWLRRSPGDVGEYLYLVKAPGRGKASFNISYDDVAVWYDRLKQVDIGLICATKVGPPVLSNGCSSGITWINLQWNSSLPLYGMHDGYNVLYRVSDSMNWTKRETNLSTFNITGLAPSTTVEMQIQNRIHGSNSLSSQTVLCNTTYDERSVLESPLNLTADATSSRSILISWNSPSSSNSSIKGYWLLYKDNNSDTDFTKLKLGLPPSNQFLITGLAKSVTYRIYLVAVGMAPYAPSKPSELIAATDDDDLNTVPRINVNPVNLKTLQLDWKPPNPNRQYWYKVFMKWKEGDMNQIQEIYSGRSTSYTLVSSQSLPFPQQCNVIVMPPTPITATVANLTVDSVTWNSALISWKETNNGDVDTIIDTYRVIISSSDKTVTFVLYKPYARLGGFKQMTSYRVNVQQGNSKGFGPLLDQNLMFRTEDADECSGLRSYCEKRDVLTFDNDNCARSVLQCNSNARCINTEGSFLCKCNNGFVGDGWDCQEIPRDTKEIDFCSEETVEALKWSRTLRGQSDAVACPEGVTGIARRECGGPVGELAVWGVPDLSGCISKWALDMNDMASDPSVPASSVAEQTANLTNKEQADKIYPGDLKVVVNVLGLLSVRGEKNNDTSDVNKETSQFTESVVNTASNILDTRTIGKWTYIPQGDRKRNVGALLNTMDSVALQQARSGNHSRTAMANVVLDVFSTLNGPSNDVVIGSDKLNKDVGNPYAVFPSSEFGQGPQHITYVSYLTIGSLLTPQSTSSSNVNSSVVSLTVSNLKRKVFNDPVVIIFARKQENVANDNASCAFWDMAREPGHWSRDGCYVNSTNSSHTVCHCYHLTSFAVLMNVKGDPSHLVQGRHKLALTLITYIGVVLSIVALCLTFFTFITFRFLKSSRTFIHTNLALSLIFAQLLFLFGINKTSNKLVCQIIAGVLHYTWLTSFVWMALEGVMLYLMLVKVFGTKTMTRKRRIIFLTIGWCFPLLIVGISAGVHPQGYGNEYYCWLSIDHGFIWAFVGPALLVIAFNFLMMGIAFSVMSARGGHRRKPSKIRKIRYWAKACTLLTCILGLTWLFGVFYINHATLFMAYFFTIFNSLQGVFIFLFHCVGDEKIRREYLRILCCRERGPAYTMASHSKTPKSDVSGTNSGAKLIKSTDKIAARISTNSTGIDSSSDSAKPVLVMYQKRSSFGTKTSLHHENDIDKSSQRSSGEVLENQRDSMASFSSFRNQNRYSLVSGDDDNGHLRLGNPSVLQEVTGQDQNTSTSSQT